MRPLGILLLAALLAPAALASHDTGCVVEQWAGGVVFLDTGPLHEREPAVRHLYVFQDHPNGFVWPTAETWIYEESNGLEGLQRARGADYNPSETCGHPPDTIVW